jgi:hypothetical protein
VGLLGRNGMGKSTLIRTLLAHADQVLVLQKWAGCAAGRCRCCGGQCSAGDLPGRLSGKSEI